MAKNNRDRLIETFISRSRNTRGPNVPNTPRVSGTSGYRPLKQGTVPGYRPKKRNQRIARY
jgi:hypothetical protein